MGMLDSDLGCSNMQFPKEKVKAFVNNRKNKKIIGGVKEILLNRRKKQHWCLMSTVFWSAVTNLVPLGANYQ
jgi:hypothetical protein